MTEAEYWLNLEYRLCSEFEGLAAEEFRGLWCDGFMPDSFEVRHDGAWMTGSVWIARGGREQEQWRFELKTGNRTGGREEVNWGELLPADDVTGWLSVDWPRRLITIRPQMAHPDREPDQR